MLSEAIRWMSEPELPKAEDLREQIVNMVLWKDGDSNAGDSFEPMLHAMIIAYEAALAHEHEQQDEDNEYAPSCSTPADAESLMRKAFVRAMCAVMRRDEVPCDREGAEESFWWPECLKYDRNLHNRPLMAAIGRALGYRCGVRTKHWYEHCRKEYAAC